MKMHKSKKYYLLFTRIVMILTAASFVLTGCQKNIDEPQTPDAIGLSADFSNHVKQKQGFLQTNLVANNTKYPGARIDPVLLNAWGLAFSPGGVAWIGAQAGHVSTVYNSEGVQLRPAVAIPSPGGATGGNPTGVVFNGSTTDFALPAPNSKPALFLFVGVDGILSGWNGSAGNTALLIKNNVATSAYTGLAIASNNGANFLYAANFRAGRIDVWDKDFNVIPMPFHDRHLPAGYSPFNIQKLGDALFVMYAKVGPDGRSKAGRGNGFVDIYNTNGSFIKRFVSQGQLDAPWGVAKAPSTFFGDGDDDSDDKGKDKDENNKRSTILIGNFGNGHINAYRSDGKFIGELATHKSPIVIDELWAISFVPSTATALDSNRLYFTAGPDEEADGLFGYIKKKIEIE
ncbi:MAG: TIGR03118 family protein [Ferruginibacter sp.]